MALNQKSAASAIEIDRLATQLAKDPQSKAFLPLAEEYCKVGMWEEAVAVLEDGLKYYPGFITAMVALGRAYDQLNQLTKARAVLEGAIKLSPENLRAHRTLIKIYKAQGLTEEAVKSCRVILSMNPRDEEALSVQASLDVPTQTEPEKPKSPAPFTASTEPLPAMTEEPNVAVEEPVRDMEKPVVTTAGTVGSPIDESADITESAFLEHVPTQVAERSAINPHSESSLSAAEPSTQNKTIVRLKSWLHAIERHRRDRNTSGDLNS
ncbi:MAG TPA: tetratricopeptide repeat protein [Nitrospira sp.]|nr:tetratricopeptide repeat protein [Nitrospira sp.]